LGIRRAVRLLQRLEGRVPPLRGESRSCDPFRHRPTTTTNSLLAGGHQRGTFTGRYQLAGAPPADDQFADFDAVSWAAPAAAPPTDPTDAPADLETENQALLDLAGIVVIGEYGREIEVYSRPCRKVVRYDSISCFTHLDLVQLCGDSAFHFSTSKDCSDGTQPFSRLREAIAAHAGRTDLSRTGTLGQGIWRAGGRIVLVNGGTAAAYAAGRLTRIDHPRIGNDILDFSATEPWVDFATLSAHLTSAGDYDMCRTTSQGGIVIRGTSDQKGKEFRICHIPWFAAIESGLTQTADRNRFIILDVAAMPPGRRGRLVIPGDSDLRALGLKLCAVTLRHADQVIKMFRALKGTTSMASTGGWLKTSPCPPPSSRSSTSRTKTRPG
jgi:hypothetical protein